MCGFEWRFAGIPPIIPDLDEMTAAGALCALVYYPAPVCNFDLNTLIKLGCVWCTGRYAAEVSGIVRE